jgi:hypothetical protein
VAPVDELVEVFRLSLGEFFHGKIVQYQEIGLQIVLQSLLPGIIRPAASKVGQETAGLGKQDIVAGTAGLVSQSLGQVGLTHAHRTAKDNRLLAFDKLAGGQVMYILGR